MRKTIAYVLLACAAAAPAAWADDLRLPRVDHPAWRAECGACHIPYHPGLASAKTWQGLMRNLGNHFGENASLSPADAAQIERFLSAHANPRAQETTSLRITDQRWFLREHRRLADRVGTGRPVKSLSACQACHTAAEAGNFNEHDV